MKVTKAIFEFKGWVFEWKPLAKFKVIQKRKHARWNVIVIHKDDKYKFKVCAFVPSAHLCRLLKNILN